MISCNYLPSHFFDNEVPFVLLLGFIFFLYHYLKIGKDQLAIKCISLILSVSLLFIYSIFEMPFIIAMVFLLIIFIISSIILSIYIKYNNIITSLINKIFIGLLIIVFLIEFRGDIMNMGVSSSCLLKGGRVYENACENNVCDFPAPDYGKDCSKDEDCTKFCEIDNTLQIKSIFMKNFSNKKQNYSFYEDRESCNYYEIDINEWKEKTGIIITGKCSKYFFNNYYNRCSSIESRGVGVNENKLKVKN